MWYSQCATLPMGKPKKVTAPKASLVHMTLTIGTASYKSEGATILEALLKLKKPEKIMNKGILTVEQDGKVRQQLFFPQRLKRLFYNPTFQVIQAKMLEKIGLKAV